MENRKLALFLFNFLVWFLFSLLVRDGVVEASHVVYEELQSISPSIVSSKHRTGFHFQPQRNWLNGMMTFSYFFYNFFGFHLSLFNAWISIKFYLMQCVYVFIVLLRSWNRVLCFDIN